MLRGLVKYDIGEIIGSAQVTDLKLDQNKSKVLYDIIDLDTLEDVYDLLEEDVTALEE